MERAYLVDFDLQSVNTPCFVVDEWAIEQNLITLDKVQQRTGCKVLLALKAFAMPSMFPLIRRYLHGVCASSPHEARLGKREFRKEVHSHGPAFSERDLEDHLDCCDHLVLNSFSQWHRFRDQIRSFRRNVSCGLRVNPAHSETDVALYDPCSNGSRLGILRDQFDGQDLTGISGLHLHTLCEKGADALARTADIFEKQFGEFLPQMEWVNLGGGHLITAPGYDIDLLCDTVEHFSKKYELTVYLEPGEAVAINSGALVTSVLDIIDNNGPIAILDTSVSCHMPDVLEMPYRPEIRGASLPGELPYTYRLGGVSCLAGDVLGEYSFVSPLQVGERLLIEDMSHYTMVKTNTFNGIRLPDINLFSPLNASVETVGSFDYESFRHRLG